jgi:hypothetical protein
MSERVASILALLDEGLAIYRRSFGSFLLLAAGWFVPVAISVGLLTAAFSSLDETTAILLSFAIGLLALPIIMYLIGGLSRAANGAIEGRPILFRAAIGLHPFRVVGMSIFTIIYGLVLQIVSGLFLVICFCPVIFAGSVLSGLLIAASNGANEQVSTILGIVLVLLLGGGIYISFIVVAIAGNSSLVYMLQPWVLGKRRFGEALQQSMELLGYEFRHNIITWLIAATVFTSAGLSVAIVIGVLIPLPTIWLLGEESPLAQAISATAWLLGLVLVLPTMPIWMTQLYRRNQKRRNGSDLEERVQAWADE